MEARWLAYIGSGLLAAASLVPSTFLTSPAEGPDAQRGATVLPDEPIQALVDVERQTERLRQYMTAAPIPRQPGRNPFRYGTRPAPHDTRRAAPRAPGPPAATPEPEPLPDAALPSAPPPLRLIGMAEQAEGDGVVRTAIIRAFADVHLVRVGDLIAERYTVTAIGSDAVELLDTMTQQVVRLALRP